MGILVRALAVAAALTSTSLRERWREPGEEAAAGVRVWAALAGEGRPKQRDLDQELRLKHFLFPLARLRLQVHLKNSDF